MLPPIISTTPNSPSVCAKLNTNPVSTPGKPSGNTILQKVRQRDAPSVADASISLWSTDGKSETASGEGVIPASEWTERTNRNQHIKAEHRRRQHDGQRNHGFDQK